MPHFDDDNYLDECEPLEFEDDEFLDAFDDDEDDDLLEPMETLRGYRF